MTEAPAPAMVWCPFPDVVAARGAAATLLDEGLVACVNILPGMETHYAWNGAREQGAEAGALFKTNVVLLEKVVARLAALHPYEEPAVLGWRCDAAAPETAVWLGGLVG